MTNRAYTLGISSHFHDSAAALVSGTRVIAAAQEERFTRRKADASFPTNAIRYCLDQIPGGAAPDAIAYYENPALKTDRIVRNAASNAPRGAAIWPQTLSILRELTTRLPEQLQEIGTPPEHIYFVPHHRSHAGSAFYPSPFTDAAVLVLDGVGEWATTSLWSADSTRLEAVGEIRFPHSLGLFYSAFTQYCGFKVNSGEYKLMGLAPFGKPQFRQLILDELIDLKADGSFALNMSYFGFATGLSTTSPLFERLFGRPSRRPDEPVTQHFMDVAASAQAVLEEAVLRLCTTTLKLTGQKNLCLAGGVALNCVANRRVLLETPGLEDLWIQPAAGDAGGALGAALDVAHAHGMGEVNKAVGQRDQISSSLLGPEYAEVEILEALESAGLVYERPLSGDVLCQETAEALSKGQIVGHFDGPMEFGPRALGNRSILADPRPVGTLGRVNRRIKFREDWRPFAPMVLAEFAAEYFEAPTDSPYMLLVAELRSKFRHGMDIEAARARGLHDPLDLQNAVASRFPAVTHVDFSARLQSIDAEFGSRAHDIVRAFHRETDCPMLLNTSFNVRGEPIVCSPEDAVACFLNTHIDLLVIGPYLVRKSEQGQSVQNLVGRMTFDSD